ncbi:unnamed protein product, partial [Rotaria sp. Silwood1]
MISDLIIIIIIICSFELYSVLTNDINLIHTEENILYSHLKTPLDLNLFYQKLLESNEIDDITRIHRIITQDDIQQFNFENK